MPWSHLLDSLDPEDRQTIANDLPDLLPQEQPCARHISLVVQDEALVRPIVAEVPIGVERRRQIVEIERDTVWFASRCGRFDQPGELRRQLDQLQLLVAQQVEPVARWRMALGLEE